MNIKTTALVTGLMMASSVNAATVTFSFLGQSSTNPGVPGVGPVSGNIVIDTDAAVQTGSSTVFTNAFSNIDFTANGAAVTSFPFPLVNSVTQVQLASGDAFLSNYQGSFAPSGVAGVAVNSVALEIRGGATDLFDASNSGLLDALQAGDSFDLDDLSFISLVVRYSNSSNDATILRKNNFSQFSVSVTDPTISPIPLPAGLPLLLMGMGGLFLARRRKS